MALYHHVTLTKGVQVICASSTTYQVRALCLLQLKAAPELTDLLNEIPLTKRRKKLEVLQRLTVTVEDSAMLHTLVSVH